MATVLFTNRIFLGYIQKSPLCRIEVSVICRDGAKQIRLDEQFRTVAKPEWCYGKNRIMLPILTPAGATPWSDAISLVDKYKKTIEAMELDSPENYVYMGRQ